MKKSRPVIDIVKFIKVLKDRENYPDVVSASNALGMTVSSLQQKIARERKRYPRVFESIENYKDNRKSNRLLSENELMELLG